MVRLLFSRAPPTRLPGRMHVVPARRHSLFYRLASSSHPRSCDDPMTSSVFRSALTTSPGRAHQENGVLSSTGSGSAADPSTSVPAMAFLSFLRPRTLSTQSRAPPSVSRLVDSMSLFWFSSVWLPSSTSRHPDRLRISTFWLFSHPPVPDDEDLLSRSSEFFLSFLRVIPLQHFDEFFAPVL